MKQNEPRTSFSLSCCPPTPDAFACNFSFLSCSPPQLPLLSFAVDGGHLAQEALSDAVFCFQLLRSKGVLAFDDYDSDLVKTGLDAFLRAFSGLVDVAYAGYTLVLVKH